MTTVPIAYGHYTANIYCCKCNRFMCENVTLPLGKRIGFCCKECKGLIAVWDESIPSKWFDMKVFRTVKGTVKIA